MNKICSKCKRNLNVLDFPKSSTGKYGVHSWCKLCHKEYGILHKKERYIAVKRYKVSHVTPKKELKLLILEEKI